MANALTIMRLFLIVPLVAVFLANITWGMKAALAIFAIAALTDMLDGWVARARGEESALGAALDPIADKALVATAILLLTRNAVIRDPEIIAAVIIIAREVVVAGLREALGRDAARLPVSRAAKAKTVVQLAALSLLLASAPAGLIGEPARDPALLVFWFAAALTLWTGVDYSLKAAAILSPR